MQTQPSRRSVMSVTKSLWPLQAEEGWANLKENGKGRNMRGTTRAPKTYADMNVSYPEHKVIPLRWIHLCNNVDSQFIRNLVLKIFIEHCQLWEKELRIYGKERGGVTACWEMTTTLASFYALEHKRKTTLVRPYADPTIHFASVMMLDLDRFEDLSSLSNFFLVQRIFRCAFGDNLLEESLRLIVVYADLLGTESIITLEQRAASALADFVNNRVDLVKELRALGFI